MKTQLSHLDVNKKVSIVILFVNHNLQIYLFAANLCHYENNYIISQLLYKTLTAVCFSLLSPLYAFNKKNCIYILQYPN